MKNQLKGFVIGVIFTSLLLFSFNSFAVSVVKTIKVAMNTVKISINGEDSKTPNFVYNGSTYVQVRDLCRMLDNEFIYDSKAKTIQIYSPTEEDDGTLEDIYPTNDITGDTPDVTPTPEPITTPSSSPTPAPTPTPKATPSPIPAATPTPIVIYIPAPTPTPIVPQPDYVGYNAACSALDAVTYAANNALSTAFYQQYLPADTSIGRQIAYNIMQENIAANNAKLASDKQALKSQYHIP